MGQFCFQLKRKEYKIQKEYEQNRKVCEINGAILSSIEEKRAASLSPK